MVTQTHSLDLELSSSQYAKISDAAQTGLDFSTAMTLELWVKFESFPSGLATFVSKFGVAGTRSFIFFFDTGGTPSLRINIYQDGTNVEQELVSWSPSLATWYHVAVTYNGTAGEVKFYVDGVQQGSTQTTSKTSIFDSTSSFAIGAISVDTTPAYFFDGLIKDVRAWNVVRTVTEINDNKDNCSLSASETGLKGWWALNNNYLDETTNNNDLTASGSPVFSTDIPYACAGGPSQNSNFLMFLS